MECVAFGAIPESPAMIPSQNAMRYAVHTLRRLQHSAMRDALICERAGWESEAKLLRLQGDDAHQVAQFLEERVIEQPKRNRRKKA